MSLYYGARVTVGGDTIADVWDGSSDLVGIADIQITAGRDTIYSEEQPASATIKLIDPTGAWAFRSRVGDVLVRVDLVNLVWYTSNEPAHLFFGRSSNITADRAKVYNPSTKQPQDVWIVTIAAKDGMVDLDSISGAGPAADGSWPRDLAQNWIAHIRTQLAGKSNLIGDLAEANVINVGPLPASTKLGDVIRWLYASDRPTYQPIHDPTTGDILVSYGLETVDDAGLALQLDGSTVVIRPTSDQTQTFPANQIIMPDGYAPTMDVGDAIDIVHVTYLDSSGNDQTYTTQTARNDPGRLGTRDWSIKTVLTSQTDATALAAAAVATADAMNDTYRVPRIQHRPEFWGFFTAQDQNYWMNHFADRLNSNGGYYFHGSLYNSLPNMPVIYKGIKREASFTADGWVISITLIPAAPANLSTLTLADLSHNATATLADCEDAITVGVLANVTEGLAA